MAKTIIKEIIILLLLIVAVLLAAGVLLYDYIPNNKTVPSVELYKTSESVSKEISEPVTEDETVLVTYEITSGDLKNLTKTNTLVSGKQNPFSTYNEPVENTTEEGNNNLSGNKTGTNTSKGNTFYNNTGTK